MLALAALGNSPGTAAEPSAAAVAAGRVHDADICIYGGTSAGVAAAIQASRMGRRAVIVMPGRQLGGMTTAGLGYTDFGSKDAIGGIARDFYRRIRDYYQRTYGANSKQAADCGGGYRFEPSVAARMVDELLTAAGVPVFAEQRLTAVTKSGARITQISMEGGQVFRARMFIDATYEGDLMARARVSYTVGREANARYGETLNGVQFGHPGNNFKVFVDPYVVEGDPRRGLLPGVSDDEPGVQGEGDRRVQAYNFRMCLTNIPQNMVYFPRPKDYDPARYTLLARYIKAGVWDALRLASHLPNGKTDTNNHGAFSTDYIGGSHAWPEADYATRARIFQEHLDYQQGLLYFLVHDERVPLRIRQEVGQWGLARDEFVGTGNWPHELYVREARRMVSDYVMTEHNCRGRALAEDSVGLAAYTMDSHHVRRVVRDGRVVNEGDVQVGGFPPYPIAYRAIVPRATECDNLLVPVCLSSSHIAYGSIRMEPVFMVLGQSAAAAASLALDAQCAVQQVDYSRLRTRLLKDGQILDWGAGGPAGIAAVMRAPYPLLPEPEPAASIPLNGEQAAVVGRPTEVTSARPAPAPAALPARSIDAGTLKGIVLDEGEAKRVGEWRTETGGGGPRLGGGFLHDGNADKGLLSITYAPDLPVDGSYEIRLIFPPDAGRATNVPVVINVEGLGRSTMRVDQRNADAGGVVSLGVFKLPRGRLTSVTLSNRNTDGAVVADGVQFLPL